MNKYWINISNISLCAGKFFSTALPGLIALIVTIDSIAQSAPTKADINTMSALHIAAHAGNVVQVQQIVDQGFDLETTDRAGRTAVHIAAFASQDDVLKTLAAAGADLNALEHRAYDIVTIAAVANDLQFLDLALSLGARASNVTSPYEGTALIAAAHLGHHEIVTSLIHAGAPLDHVNNLGWTALIEAVILGDGGPNHRATVRALVDAGADKTITDREGISPLQHAKRMNYREMVELLQ